MTNTNPIFPKVGVLATWFSLLVLVGCGGDSSGLAALRTQTDSAGVRIVEFSWRGSWEMPFVLTERLRLGVLDGPEEYMFSTIAGGVLLDEGSFAVSDRESSQVRTFSRDGTLITSQGRSGRGPGEYEYIRAVGRCRPAGFTVFDLHWRVNQYDGSGVFQETWQPMLEGGMTPYQLACSPSGRFAATNWGALDGPPVIGLFSSGTRLRILRPDGTEEFDLGERIGSERVGTQGGSRPHPFGRGTLLDFDGEDLIVADGTFFGYERWSPEGRLAEIVRVRVPAPNLDSLVNVQVEERIARLRQGDQENIDARIATIREEGNVLRGLARATHISDLRVLDRHVLLQAPAASATRVLWIVFAADGTPLGELRLPPAARLLDFQGDWILTAEMGASDVPQVAVYEVRRER
jgi:hypothetical protein